MRDQLYHRRKLTLIFSLMVLFAPWVQAQSSAPKVEKDWWMHALRMTGESDAVRTQSLKVLKSWPDLENKMRQELDGSHRGLALDVIAALRLENLLGDLLRVGELDPSGLTYLAVNSLVNSKNQARIVTAFKARLFCTVVCATAGPSQVIIIDTLARMKIDLTQDQLQLLSESSWPETRSAVLDYARSRLSDSKDPRYLEIVQKSLKSPVRQLRIQAMYLISELKSPLKAKALDLLDCANEKHPQVRQWCLEIRKEKT